MSSRRRPRSLLGAAAIATAGVAALGCDLLPKDEDEATKPAAATNDVIAGCEPTDGAPDDLRCTGLYTDIAAKIVSPRARSFAPSTSFWSDGAEKHRWIELPAGAKIDTTSMDEWRYPIGTKVWKELEIGGRRIETRFMQKVRDDRWLQAAYVWSADESNAVKREGAVVDLGGGQTYVVPKSSECNDCHKGKKDRLLGFEAISLGQPDAAGLTLGVLAAEGRLTAPPVATRVAIPDDGSGHAAAALAWMHVNCGTSCHTGTSAATAYGSGLRMRIGWDEIAGKPLAEWEVVKSTVGAAVKSPAWSGEPRIAPGDPQASVILRLLGQRGAEQMPPIATKLVDEKGRVSVESWIAAMPKPRVPPVEEPAPRPPEEPTPEGPTPPP